jgi:hypothetical protein
LEVMTLTAGTLQQWLIVLECYELKKIILAI